MLHPRPYQRQLIDSVYTSWERGLRRPLAVLPTGGGKCLTPDTLVWSRGLHRFGDLWGSQRILGPAGPAVVEGWHDDGERDGIRLTTALGWTVDGTAEHRVWVRNRNGYEGWRCLGEVGEGDFVGLARGVADFGHLALDEDIAYFLGLFIADGCVTNGGGTERLQIDKQRPVLEAVTPVVMRIQAQALGQKPAGAVRIVDKSPNHSFLLAHAPGWRRVLSEKYGCDASQPCHLKRTPSTVLRGDRKTVVAYLRGLFDGDGYCAPAPGLSTSSPELAREVQAMLLGLGVLASLRVKQTPGLFAYVITVNDPQAFADEVGFTRYGLTKDRAFDRLLEVRRNSNVDVVPGVGELLRAAAAKVPRKQTRDDAWRHVEAYYSGVKLPSYAALMEMHAGMPFEGELLRVLQERRAWLPVARIEPSRAHRIDCQVAEQHAFIGNGMVNHNTVCFATIIRERGARTLVLAHRDELVEQAVEKIRRCAPEMTVGVVKAERDQVLCKVVVASVQTLARPARLEQLKVSAGHRPGLFADRLGPVGLVVVDEAHHAHSENSYGKLLRELGAFEAGGPQVVGFTATPERMDKHSLSSVWEEIAFQHGLLDGIREGYLVDPRGIEAQLAVDFGQLKVRAGDYAQDELDALLRAADAPHHVVATYLEQCQDRKGVVFTVSVKGAHEMAAAFREAGVPAEALDGSMARDHRRAILARLRSGETQVVANAAVLTEGWDEPSISCVVIARPTRSRVLAIQMIGRGLRPAPGKTDCLVIDTVGMSRRTDLVTLAALAGVTKRQAEQGLRTALLDRVEAEAAAAAQQATQEELALAAQDDGTLIYRQFDLRTGSRLHWVETRHGQWVLSMGKQGTVHVAPDPAGFRVVRLWRGEDGGQRRAVVKVTPSLEEAQAEAEARVRKVGMVQANSRSAEWRRRPPTHGQVQLLGKLGLALPPTMGEASDLITRQLTRAV